MSDEEKKAIKKVKYICDKWYDENLEIDVKWLESLLSLCEKQQKEIEELKKKTRLIKSYKGNLPENVEIICLCKNDFERNISEDYISKDKIKAKIKEAEKIIKEDRKELNFGTTLRDDILQGIVYKIDFNTRLKNILESLLEKE